MKLRAYDKSDRREERVATFLILPPVEQQQTEG